MEAAKSAGVEANDGTWIAEPCFTIGFPLHPPYAWEIMNRRTVGTGYHEDEIKVRQLHWISQLAWKKIMVSRGTVKSLRDSTDNLAMWWFFKKLHDSNSYICTYASWVSCHDGSLMFEEGKLNAPTDVCLQYMSMRFNEHAIMCEIQLGAFKGISASLWKVLV